MNLGTGGGGGAKTFCDKGKTGSHFCGPKLRISRK